MGVEADRLAEIDAAVKEYNRIGEEEENAERTRKQLGAIKKVKDAAFQFSVQHNLDQGNKYRGVLNLLEAADDKYYELNTQVAQDFQKPEVKRPLIEKIVPGFYAVKNNLDLGYISPAEAARTIFNTFIAYSEFTYTTEATGQTIPKGFQKGACQDFSQALADLFKE